MRRTLLTVWCVFAACGSGHPSPAPSAAAVDAEAPSGAHEVVVFATASLRRPFEALARQYERQHAGAKVTLRCEGGAQLLAAMNAGEHCDVVAIGDSSLMSRFAAAALLAPGSPTELARNRIAIAVAKGNPKGVRDLADFARADLRIVLGARSSSIGRHARWALSRQTIDPSSALDEPTADAVMQRVAAGEADAGIVYATSFEGIGDRVESIHVPEADNTPVLYSISAIHAAQQPRGAAAFRALCLGPEGQRVLHEHGFLPIGDKLR